jgi:hypothetical protein
VRLFLIFYALGITAVWSISLLHGCYLEHDAASSGGQAAFEAAGSGSSLDAATNAATSGRQRGSDPRGDGSNPSAATDRCPGGFFTAYYGCVQPGSPWCSSHPGVCQWCEGPYVGCIAPGSRLASDAMPRPQ